MDNEMSSEETLRLIFEQKNAYTKEVALSTQELTEDERRWIRQVLGDYNPSALTPSPSYFYRKRTEIERNENIPIVRKELEDILRNISELFTPEQLLEYSDKNARERRGIENFPGIYIIHNRAKDKYYVGQAVSVFDRAYEHFSRNRGNPGIYKDYRLGEDFSISLIPLEKTSYSSLNELEDNAIRAYESYENGYNRMPGNLMDKPIFKNGDYQKAADLILDKIKGTDIFLTLTNDRKRMLYTKKLLLELVVPRNAEFTASFVNLIKEYQKANKKR